MRKRNGALAAAATAAVVAVTGSAIAAIAPIDTYADPVVPEYETVKVISSGDTIPETSDPSTQYQVVGIPDGLGAHRGRGGTRIVYMNHELGSAVESEPTVGQPLNRGAFVSRLVLDGDGEVLSGERAYDTVYIDDTLVGPAPEVGNATRAFSRLCSGSLAGPDEGFDRPIYFANEEDGTPATTFDGKGGLSVAIFDNQAHALTGLGRFAWENTLVQPGTGKRTVIMGMEDGPAALDPAVENSQLYMYVGRKDRSRGASVLQRNGLVGGKLYVFAAKDPAVTSELQFQDGTMAGTWVEIPGADQLDEAGLEAASDAAGAMAFARPEDGAFNTRNDDQYFWVTTGGAAGANTLGRVYSLDLDTRDPVRDANGTIESRAVMAAKGRDGSIWRYELDGRSGIEPDSATRVVSLSPPGRDGAPPVGPGVWETSGIIDGAGLFGGGSWLFDVQAHAPTAAPRRTRSRTASCCS